MVGFNKLREKNEFDITANIFILIEFFNTILSQFRMALPINVVSSSPVHGEMYSIQHYVIKFVSDLRHVGGFLRVLRFNLISSTNKTERHYITIRLLKVALNTIILTPLIRVKIHTPGIRILGTGSNTKNRVRQVTTTFSGEYALSILSDRQRY